MKLIIKPIIIALLFLGVSFTSQAQNTRLTDLQDASSRLYSQFREFVANNTREP